MNTNKNTSTCFRFKSKLWMNKEYLIIPAKTFQKWNEELLQISQINGAGGNVFQCSITNAPHGRGKLNTDFSIIRNTYGIKKAVLIRFHFVQSLLLIFSIPRSQKTTPSDVNNLVHGNSTNAKKLPHQAPENLFFTNIPKWGSDVPLWESKISKSMANGRQPLLVPAIVVHTMLATRPTHLPVLLPGGEFQNWNLIWNNKQSSQCHIGRGWYNFAKTHSINIGDNIQFWAGEFGITSVTIITG